MELNPYQAPPERDAEPSGTGRVLTIVSVMALAIVAGVGLAGIVGFASAVGLMMIFEAAGNDSGGMVFVALGVGALVGMLVMLAVIIIIARLLMKHYEAK
jgi:hypothetical protein